MTTLTVPALISVGHTPDMDDAFMFYAMAEGKIDMGGTRIKHVIEDIQSLNKRAFAAELDVTAISAATFPFVEKDYWILAVGSSVGTDYGPLVVSKTAYSPQDLNGRRVAVPGLKTTAYLMLKLAIQGIVPVEMSFETIPEAVLRGEVDAGLLIHEKQLTYRDQGLLPILDLGVWWHNSTSLPLPLGLNVIKQSLGESVAAQFAQWLRDSIIYAMTHQDEAMASCMRFGRGIDATRARQFVGMYVNEETLLLSPKTRTALALLFQKAHGLGLIENIPRLHYIEPPAKV